MAVHRNSPTCPYCNKVIGEAIYDQYLLKQNFCGDAFTGWKYEKHDCQEAKDYWKKIMKTPEGKALKKTGKKLAESMKKSKQQPL